MTGQKCRLRSFSATSAARKGCLPCGSGRLRECRAYADAARYTAENIAVSGEPSATPTSPCTWWAACDQATEDDYRRFAETAHRELAVGLSMTTAPRQPAP